MENSGTMTDGSRKVGWFAAGALAVALAIAIFLYADGYFDKKDSIELNVDLPKVEIEAK